MPRVRGEGRRVNYDRLRQTGWELENLIAKAKGWLEEAGATKPQPPLIPLRFESGPHRILFPRDYTIRGGLAYQAGQILSPAPSLVESCLEQRDCQPEQVRVESVALGPSTAAGGSGVDIGSVLVEINGSESPAELTGLVASMALAVEAGVMDPHEYRDFIERLAKAADEAYQKAMCALNTVAKTVAVARILAGGGRRAP